MSLSELGYRQAAEMFYFYFESQRDPSNDPVVLWMTGAIQPQQHCIVNQPCVPGDVTAVVMLSM